MGSTNSALGNGRGGTRNRKMSYLKFLLFCLFFKGVIFEENIFGTPVDFFQDFISELNLDFVMILKNSKAEDEKGIRILFDQLCQDGKRVSVIDYPLSKQLLPSKE